MKLQARKIKFASPQAKKCKREKFEFKKEKMSTLFLFCTNLISFTWIIK
jgi:hypothetical protein